MPYVEKLTEPQEDFVFSRAKFPAFVGGYGAGKTKAGHVRALKLAVENPNGRVGLYAPTYDLVRKNFFKRIEQQAKAWGLRGVLNKSDNTFTLARGGQILFGTMDNPDLIVGYELTDAILDELDVLPADKAEEVFTKVLARCRFPKKDKSPNTVAVTTTPEGFKFTYDRWGNDPKPGYELIRAPTSSNLSLPDDYVDSIKGSFAPHLLAAYLEGQFVNLATGSVYPDFDKVLNHTDETIQPGEVLHVGLDFNVNNMTAIVCVLRNGEPRVLGELTKISDTPTMCAKLRETYPGYRIVVYPDASGQAGSTKDASNSDLQILKNAKFEMCLKEGVSGGYYNPKVKDRVAAMNAQILNGDGRRRLKVNTKLCPTVADHLSQQVYDKAGNPEKGKKTGEGKDHAPDALGYFISYAFPIVKPVATRRSYSNHMAR